LGTDVIIRTPYAKAAADFQRQVLAFAVTQRFAEIVGFETGTFSYWTSKVTLLAA